MTKQYLVKLLGETKYFGLATIVLTLTSCDKLYEQDIVKYYAEKDKVEILVEDVIVDSTRTKEDVKILNKEFLDKYIEIHTTQIGYSSTEDFLSSLDSSNWESRKATEEKVLRLRKNDFMRGVDSEDATVRRISRMILAEPTYYEITLKYRTMNSGPLLIEKFSVLDYRDSVNLKLLEK
jgi:hypothetical protein